MLAWETDPLHSPLLMYQPPAMNHDNSDYRDSLKGECPVNGHLIISGINWDSTMPAQSQAQIEKYRVSDCMSRPSHFDLHTLQAVRPGLFSGEISVATSETFQPGWTIQFVR